MLVSASCTSLSLAAAGAHPGLHGGAGGELLTHLLTNLDHSWPYWVGLALGGAALMLGARARRLRRARSR